MSFESMNGGVGLKRPTFFDHSSVAYSDTPLRPRVLPAIPRNF